MRQKAWTIITDPELLGAYLILLIPVVVAIALPALWVWYLFGATN